LAALLHGTLVVGVSQTAALNRGRHLYSAGRPSRWALAHISSCYCGQTAGCINMPLGMEAGFSPGDFVLDGAQPLPNKWQSLQFSAHAYCGRMDQDATWYGDRPRPTRHCVRWGLSYPSPKGAQPPNFWLTSVVSKRLDGLRCHLVWR